MGISLRGRSLRVTVVFATLVSFVAGIPAAWADNTVPGSVQAPVVQGVAATSISVGWLAPADASAVSGYRVDYSNDQGATWQTGVAVDDPSATSATVSGLGTGVSYDLRIEAYGPG